MPAVVTLRELADRLQCRLEGDGDLAVSRVAALDAAGPGDLSFLANPKYTPRLAATQASAVILPDDAPAAPCAMLRTAQPYIAWANAVTLFAPAVHPPAGISPHAAMAPDARIGAAVSIGAFVSVGAGAIIGDRTVVYPNVTIGDGVQIGEDCVIHSNCALRERVVLGRRVVLQNGVVIGSDGYGFAKRADGTHQKIPQTAPVVIEDDVELGANTTVDRPAIGETRIRAGAKIDNLVQIAHGVTIGRRTLFAAQVGIAGSTTIGDDVMLGGQVGVGGHLDVGDRVIATGQTGITHDIPAGTFVSGTPAIPNAEWRKSAVLFRRLPELRRQLAELEARLAAIDARRLSVPSDRREPNGPSGEST